MWQINYFIKYLKPLNKGHLFLMDSCYFFSCFHLRAVPLYVAIHPLSPYIFKVPY